MNLLIIQARMGSSRLPGKVMKRINDIPLLQILYDRILNSSFTDKIIIATTTNKEDDIIIDFCDDNNIDFYRGSDWDVLDRFYQTAISQEIKPKNIIRICADNPLLSYKVIDFVIENYIKSGKDYFSNSNHEPNYLEDGFDVEVFSYKALANAWKNAKLTSEREHICPYIKKNFSCGWEKAHDNYNFKLSVDNKNDFEIVTQIFNELNHIKDFSIKEVVELLLKKPYLLNINKESKINSGYLKSLKNDQKIGE
jgi:spore coat polysaccharide biosynthesis protein SpsF